MQMWEIKIERLAWENERERWYIERENSITYYYKRYMHVTYKESSMLLKMISCFWDLAMEVKDLDYINRYVENNLKVVAG